MTEPLTELLHDIFVISDHTDEKEINTMVNISDYALCLKYLRRKENGFKN
jgi:hypothetical protein